MSIPTPPKALRAARVASAFTLLATLVVVVACSKPDAPPSSPPSVPAASALPSSVGPLPSWTGLPASSAPAPPVVMPDPEPEGPRTWTDPSIVAELAKNCRYMPEGAAVRKDEEGDASDLSCAASLFYQSCTMDPCHDEDQAGCKPKCMRGCTACSAGCVTSCEACKKPCKDDACREACAQKCGACKQECLAAKDRCSSGTCAASYKGCRERLVSRWNASGCPAACPQYNACNEACPPSDLDTISDPCLKRCREVLMRACPQPFSGICMFQGVGPDGP